MYRYSRKGKWIFQFVLFFVLSGHGKKGFHIELNNEILTISSQREDSHELKKGDRYARREFSYQSFARSFHLPKSVVDDSKINARYENGVLRVSIPKKAEAKPLPPRQIAIN